MYKFNVTYDNRTFIVHMESEDYDAALYKLLFMYPKCKYQLIN